MSDQVRIEEEITKELELNYKYILESKEDKNSGVFTFTLNDYAFRVKSTPSPIDCNIEILHGPFSDSEEHKKMQNAISRMLRNTTFSANDQYFMQHANTIINLCSNFILKRGQKEPSDAKQSVQKNKKKRGQHSYGPYFALAVQDITSDGSTETKQKFNGKGRSQKKASMKTAEDVIKRINWDKKLDPNCFIVGYEDRFDGTIERSFSDFNWKDDISAVGPEEFCIPQHRISYFKYNERVVWNKMDRVDDVFGSTGGQLKIMDIVEQEKNKPNNDDKELINDFSEKCETVEPPKSQDPNLSKPEVAHDVDVPHEQIKPPDGASESKHSRKPNYFIGIKVDSEEIIKNVLEIQNHFCKNKLNEAEVEILKKKFQPINKLHFTLCTCHLESDVEILSVNQVIENVCEAYSPTKVHVANVNHFNNMSIIFGRPKHEILSAFHYKFMDCLKKANIDVSENYAEYQSHMTLLMLRGNQFLKRKLKAFVKRRSNWKFGNQEIAEILLCKVGSTDPSNGFYEVVSQFTLKGSENIIVEQRRKPSSLESKPVSSKRMDYRIGVALTAVLRHNKFGFKVDSEGYVVLDDIVSHPQFHNKLNVTREDIYRIVKENDKKRFTISVIDGREKIKANQGHSVEVENLSLAPITDATLFPKVIHGTFLPVWNSIKKQGLHRKKRIHIHMTTSEPTDPNAAISGIRKSCNVYIYVNIGKAMQDGLEFFQSENGVVLSPGNKDGFILPKYFDKVINLGPNGKRHTLFESTCQNNEDIDSGKDAELVKQTEDNGENTEIPANLPM